MVSFGDTLLAAVQGVVRVLLVVVTGSAIQVKGILPASLRLGLSQLVFKLFLPCLLFTSVVKALSVSSLASLAGVFAFAVGAHFAGAAVGWVSHAVFERFAPAKYHSPVFQGPLFAACVALGNHGYLPLSLLPTVLGLLPFGSHRDADEDSADAVAITAMYIMCLNVLSWTFVHGLIRRQKRDTLRALGEQAIAVVTPKEQPSASPPASWAHGAVACVRKVLNPPLIACISGVLIGLIAPLKALLFPEVDEDAPCDEAAPTAPLQPTVTGALLSLADCTVPIVLLQLGATMTDMYTASRSAAAGSGAAPTAVQDVPPQTGPAQPAESTTSDNDSDHQSGLSHSTSGDEEATPDDSATSNPTAAGAASADVPVVGRGAASADVPAAGRGGASAAAGGADGRHGVDMQRHGSSSCVVLESTPRSDGGAGGATHQAGHELELGTPSQVVLQVHSSSQLHVSVPSRQEAAGANAPAESPLAAAKGDGQVDVALATISWPLLACVLLARLVIMPALGTALVYGLVLGGVLPTDDPVLVFVVMLQFSPPPAMNLALIGELESFAQAALGQVLFVGHLAAAVSMTAWISLQLSIVNALVDT